METPVVTISKFVESFIFVEGKPFQGECGFEYWPFLLDVYDDPHQYRIFKASRQCSKSTTIGNMILAHSTLIPRFRSLYVAPRQEQIRTFSNDRISMVIRMSPLLKQMTSTRLTNKVTEKSFINDSIVRMRSAYINPDSARGIPSRLVTIDELQDIDVDFIPVILECAATFPTDKIIQFAGTPKTLDNALEYYWTKRSTMCEWMVRCPMCGCWNGTNLENIGLAAQGYICSKCGHGLDIRAGEWVAGREDAVYAGYHINQLMTPYTHKDWNSLHIKYKEYSLTKFMNEVLGESWDSGVKPITRDELVSCCQDYKIVENPSSKISDRMTVAGIDWGTGEDSYTVLIIIDTVGTKYRVLYAKRYEGREAIQDEMLRHMKGMLNKYNVNKIGADWGFGYYYNYALQRDLHNGISRVAPIYYSAGAKKKLSWDRSGRTMTANRTMVVEDVFQLIKRREIIFPHEDQWMDPFGEDILNEYVEEGAKQTKLVYSHQPGCPDDSLHALVYAIIAAQFIQPRSDLGFNPGQFAEDLLAGGIV